MTRNTAPSETRRALRRLRAAWADLLDAIRENFATRLLHWSICLDNRPFGRLHDGINRMSKRR